MVIPSEITAKHGVVQEDVFRRGPAVQGIDDAVYEFATLANDHLDTARNMLKEGVPQAAMPVFLAGVSGFQSCPRRRYIRTFFAGPGVEYFEATRKSKLWCFWFSCADKGLEATVDDLEGLLSESVLSLKG